MKARRWMTRVGVVIGIAVFGLVPISSGQECPEYVGELRGDLWEGAPNRIEVSGSFAFLVSPNRCSKPGCWRSVVAIADVSVPEEPRVVDFLRVGTLLDFTVSGDRFYHHSVFARTTTHDDYLGIIDVSDPSHPVTLLDRFWIDDLFGIAVSGDIVVNATANGLLLLDASDPSNPTEVGFLASPWGPSDLVVEGDFAYVAVPESGLRVIDVSDSAHPVEVGSWAATWEALDLEVRDGFAFVADGVDGLRVIDVTNPSTPTEVGIFETAFEASRVSVAGAVAAVVLRESIVQIVDVSDPANPKAIGLVATDGTPLAASMSGPTIYISEGTGPEHEWGGLIDGRFLVIDLSDPALPVDLASFGYRSAAMDVEVADGEIFVAGGDAGLLVFDDSNPEGALTGFLDTPGFTLGVTLHDRFALVADGHKGLRIVDVADPMNIAEVGFFDTPGQAHSVAVGDDYAYVADGDGGLRIVDISQPEIPVEVGSIDTPEPAVDVAIWRNFAYVADGWGVRVIDVSDPTQPIDVPSPIKHARAVAVADGRLYVAGGRGFSIWDIADPLHPRHLVEDYVGGTSARDIKLSGQYAYVAYEKYSDGTFGGVIIRDILNPFHPDIVGRWEFDGKIWAVAGLDGRIYVAAGTDGVTILDSRCLTTYWVGVVAHNNGSAESRWRSDVIISHEAEHMVDIDFVLHTEHGEIAAEATIGPRSQGVFEDVVGLLGYEGKGALEIQAGVPINVVSRIYNQTDSGTSGAYFPGYRSSECLGSGDTVWLYGLRQLQGEYRTNIIVTNTGTKPGWVYITLYRSDGEELIGYAVDDIEPGMIVQDLQPFKNRAGLPNLGWGFASVKVARTQMLVSATVIDSRTNHGMIVPLVR